MHTDSLPGSIDLTGEWSFAYIGHATQAASGQPSAPVLLPAEEADARMPVPAFWDDHLDKLRHRSMASRLTFSEGQAIQLPMEIAAPDASLPCLVGLGQYERMFDAPADGRLTLELGPCFLEAWVWINGRLASHQPYYSVGGTVPLDGLIYPGRSNRVSLQVSNTSPRSRGCITRGYKGFSAGIAGPVALRKTGPSRLADCHIQPKDAGSLLGWTVEVDRLTPGDVELVWRLIDPATGVVAKEGRQSVIGGRNDFTTNATGLQCWSDTQPFLYRLEVELWDGGSLSDARSRSFGFRRIEREGTSLRLNGLPLYLRGATEHAYFPLTCTMPLDKATHSRNLAQLKRLGFNWLRFHTWVPPEPYLEAADEAGMLVQVEPPAGADADHWAAVLRACRRHPCVVIYCAGNEELLDEARLEELERWSGICRELVPDALFNPQEALRGIEYGWHDTDLGPDAAAHPYPHNARRLERLKAFSDCFGQFTWGQLSYHSTSGDPRLIDERLAHYERPCLSHEIGIHGNYLDLDLEHRYVGTRIGTSLYAAVRQHLRDRGLEHRAAEYFVNASAWMRMLRKHAIETARRCERLAGYDLLGAIDYHWHRTGYPCGMMNEFYEMKPGETVEDVRRYNAPSVLLLDHAGRWTCIGGECWSATLSASIFADGDLHEACVEWTLRDETGHAWESGRLRVSRLKNGCVTPLGDITIAMPRVEQAAALTLDVRLCSQEQSLENQWPLWVYPTPRMQLSAPGLVPPRINSEKPLRVVSNLDAADIDALARGERVLLLGVGPFPARVTVWQIACAGRTNGNLATCFHDGPITRLLPHKGFCGWNFQSMLDHGHAVLIDELGIPFDPMLEIVSSFKDARKQAALFELRVGEGRLLVCTLGLQPDDPAARHLLDLCIDYGMSDMFEPAIVLPTDRMRQMVERRHTSAHDLVTDEGFDARAQLTSW